MSTKASLQNPNQSPNPNSWNQRNNRSFLLLQFLSTSGRMKNPARLPKQSTILVDHPIPSWASLRFSTCMENPTPEKRKRTIRGPLKWEPVFSRKVGNASSQALMFRGHVSFQGSRYHQDHECFGKRLLLGFNSLNSRLGDSKEKTFTAATGILGGGRTQRCTDSLKF